MKKIKWTDRSCPVCSSKNKSQVFAEANYDLSALDGFAFASRKIPEHMHYRLITCPTCDLLYAAPLPSLDQIAKSYHEAAFDSSEEAHYAAKTYATLLPSITKNIPDTKGAVDIGTGDGAFLEELLKKRFTQVHGVEPSTAPIEASLPSIKPLIKKGLFNAKSFKKKSLSLVSCFQTFEHLYDPLKTCQDAIQLLKPGGAFYIVSHNRKSAANKMLGMKSPIFDIEHLQLFSFKSAEYMMTKAGFKNVKVKTIYNIYPLHYCFKMLPIPKKLKISMISFLKVTKLGYIPVVLPAGNMAVIGYK